MVSRLSTPAVWCARSTCRPRSHRRRRGGRRRGRGRPSRCRLSRSGQPHVTASGAEIDLQPGDLGDADPALAGPGVRVAVVAAVQAHLGEAPGGRGGEDRVVACAGRDVAPGETHQVVATQRVDVGVRAGRDDDVVPLRPGDRPGRALDGGGLSLADRRRRRTSVRPVRSARGRTVRRGVTVREPGLSELHVDQTDQRSPWVVVRQPNRSTHLTHWPRASFCEVRLRTARADRDGLSLGRQSRQRGGARQAAGDPARLPAGDPRRPAPRGHRDVPARPVRRVADGPPGRRASRSPT